MAEKLSTALFHESRIRGYAFLYFDGFGRLVGSTQISPRFSLLIYDDGSRSSELYSALIRGLLSLVPKIFFPLTCTGEWVAGMGRFHYQLYRIYFLLFNRWREGHAFISFILRRTLITGALAGLIKAARRKGRDKLSRYYFISNRI